MVPAARARTLAAGQLREVLAIIGKAAKSVSTKETSDGPRLVASPSMDFGGLGAAQPQFRREARSRA